MKTYFMKLTRRDFLGLSVGMVAVAAASAYIFYEAGKRREELARPVPGEEESKTMLGEKAKVFLVKTDDRASGIRSLFKQFDLRQFKGKKIAIKANYNSADDFPASTHVETLSNLISGLKDVGCEEIVLAERSGMGNTKDVLRSRGVESLASVLGFKTLVLDNLGEEGWVYQRPEGSHWQRGFLLAKVFREADKVVQTCCLKTHRFGGHFTLSLKNSVGAIAKYDPKDGYNYMGELHTSEYQRVMIAEINQAYRTDLILMDAIKAFATEGPEKGRVVEPNLLLAGTDRVAIDAVGVAILRSDGTTADVSKGHIFEQEQIARAAELGIGIRSAQDIQLVPVGDESVDFATKIDQMLKLE